MSTTEASISPKLLEHRLLQIWYTALYGECISGCGLQRHVQFNGKRDVTLAWQTLFSLAVGYADAQVQMTLRDERRLTGAIVCVIAKSAILISAQFNILPHCSSWSKIKSPCPYVLPYCYLICRVLHTIVHCEAQRSAILATAGLLVVCELTKYKIHSKLRNYRVLVLVVQQKQAFISAFAKQQQRRSFCFSLVAQTIATHLRSLGVATRCCTPL